MFNGWLSDFQDVLFFLFIIGFVINIILGFIIIFLEKRASSATWAWLLALFFMPIIGFIVYIFFGRKVSPKNLFVLNHDEKIGLDEIVNRQLNEINSGDFKAASPEVAKHKDQIRMMLVNQPAFLTTDNCIDVFTDGHQLFDRMIEDIKAARHHIHIEFYIFNMDGLGTRIVDALEQKLDEGVEVKMLYDSVGSKKLKKSDFNRFKQLGGQVESFFPSYIPKLNFRMNNRNHRKIVVIDGHIGYVGGFNVGDEYLGLVEKYGYWRDTHVRIHGEGVSALQLRFMLDWNSQAKRPDMKYSKAYFPPLDHPGDLSMQIASSGPEDSWHQIKFGYYKMIMSAKKSIYIQSPYFIPDESFIDALRIVSLAGVEVSLMIPNKPDHPFVYWSTYSNAARLLEAGVNVYLYEKGFIHSKVMMIDEEVTSIGTANMDFRSFQLNFEVNAFIYDKGIAEQIKTAYEQDIKDSRLLTEEDYAARSWVIKMKEAVSHLVAPIL